MNTDILKPSKISALIKKQDALTKKWHRKLLYHGGDLFTKLHYNNFKQWHEEDISRNASVSDREIACSKRNIDKLNRARIRLHEQIDFMFYSSLPHANKALPSNSELPSSIVDRLSTLSLGIYRASAKAKKNKTYKKALESLKQNRDDLAKALAELIQDLLSGKKQLKIYRHFKFYGDK